VRILFASVNHLPLVGGIELTTHQLARRLLARGHEIAVLAGRFSWSSGPTSLGDRLTARWLRLTHSLAIQRDHRFEYTVYRTLDPASSVDVVREEFRPDVVVVNAGGEAFASKVMSAARPVPTIVYFHGLGALSLLKRSDFSANVVLTVAPHLVAAAADLGYHAELITPLIEKEDYWPPTSRRVVLFVNPIAQKGADIAWALAERRQNIPFVFLKSWQLDHRACMQLRERAKNLSNVQIRDAVHDPARVYSDARILLAPYPKAEGYPRVVAEAQTLGVPVVATDVPSLRFTAGNGAIFVDEHAPIEAWDQAVCNLWEDPDLYERCSQAALVHARRPEVDPQRVIKQLEDALAAACEARTLEPAVRAF
jgi:glycosyltransferase involved in cell wall biosynthesis